MKEIKVSAPGRICLFGEHQDYLNLPVIPMAIDLRVSIIAIPRDDTVFHIQLPDIGEEEILDFSIDGEFEYVKERDYFKSLYNVLYRKGIRFECGYDCVVQGNIPINSGTSSSSALNNIWCRFLLDVGENVRSTWKEAEQVGRFSYEAEVLEFNEPGGMMDQLSTAIGGISFIDFSDQNRIEKLDCTLGTFVLGDSLQPKDTRKILAQTKAPALAAKEKILAAGYEFDFTKITDIERFTEILTENEYRVLNAMLKNRDITQEALGLLRESAVDHQAIGTLLTKHHRYLAEDLKISTPKIDRMLEAAISAGAYGGKINGSGGGGCMFAYAPGNSEQVKKAIENIGAKAFIISTDSGLLIENS